MQATVLLRRKHDKVRGMIILRIQIDMVNLLVSGEVASEYALHYVTMLKNISVWIGGGVIWYIFTNIAVPCDRVATFPMRTFRTAFVGIATRVSTVFVCVVGILDSEGFATIRASGGRIIGHHNLLCCGVKPWGVHSVARAIRVRFSSHIIAQMCVEPN
jgi:hypothetical protein